MLYLIGQSTGMQKFFWKKHARKLPIVLFVLIVLFLVISGLVLRSINLTGDQLGAAALHAQVTPTPPIEKDRSEIGSTDGIIFMAIIIMMIIFVPILIQRKSWSES
jgi:hypothetical protein